MKRHATIPITAFFERKMARRQSPVLVLERSALAPTTGTANLTVDLIDEHDRERIDSDAASVDNETEDKDDATTSVPSERVPTGMRLRRDGHHVTRLLHARELGSLGGMLQLHPQMARRRQHQQLVRWLLTQFQPTSLELGLPEHWQRQAGFLSDAVFYTSCVEFDAQGVLLVAGSSNGILALYDFDEHFYKSLNLAQRMHNARRAAQEAVDDDADSSLARASTSSTNELRPVEILRPIHTIFTRQEIKCVRWNPSNEDEVACSFSNRNEIHIFNLQKFPTKPHRVLKATSAPSSGYNDIVYMPSNATHQAPGANATPRSNVIGGDMSGAIRMWDPKVPARPIWSVSTGTYPVNALVLALSAAYLVCGTEAGYLVTFDVVNLSVPAFGSKAVPQRKASFHVLELIKPYLTSEYATSLFQSSQSSQSSGIVSVRLAPSSPTHVICQLRNDWVVVIDFLHGVVVKLHTLLKAPDAPMARGRGTVPLNVATAAEQMQSTTPVSSRVDRHSWLHHHRCAGTLLFDDSVMCTGVHDSANLNVIDLHQVPRQASWKDLHQRDPIASQPLPSAPSVASASRRPSLATNSTSRRGKQSSIGRLDRFRIPMGGVVTAVAGHPTQSVVVCGGEGMRLRVVTMNE